MPGDVVVMRVGGPQMTVEFISAEGVDINCAWFDTRNMLHRAQFNDRDLKKVVLFP